MVKMNTDNPQFVYFRLMTQHDAQGHLLDAEKPPASQILVPVTEWRNLHE